MEDFHSKSIEGSILIIVWRLRGSWCVSIVDSVLTVVVDAINVSNSCWTNVTGGFRGCNPLFSLSQPLAARSGGAGEVDHVCGTVKAWRRIRCVVLYGTLVGIWSWENGGQLFWASSYFLVH